MKTKRRGIYSILIMLLVCGWSSILFGADYTMIKVGLESIYKNVATISLSSDSNIEFGYLTEQGFTNVGTLSSAAISISKTTNQYYDIGGIYNTYQEAVVAANQKAGIPVYVEKGLFAVYSTSTSGSSVPSSTTRYMVKDSNGKVLLIFNKATDDIVFRGYDKASGLNLIKVGNSKKYRGAIGMGGTTGITPYNLISIEEYLYGVVPSEMSASWPQEALKAQAVAARSIAINHYNRYVSSGYNIVDTTSTQAYYGYNKEDPRTTAAVDVTKGQTVKYNGKVAETVYFSTSGGYTESASNVWQSHVGYLVGVQDLYETEPSQAPWTRTITLAELNTCLSKNGINIGSAQGVEIVSRTESGRVKEMRIIGTIGHHTLTKEKIRTFFSGTNQGSLKSRLFSLVGATTEEDKSSGTSTTVNVLTASGMKEVNLEGAIVTNGQTTRSLKGDTIMVQSATGITEVQMATNQNPSIPSTEIIYGDITINGKGFGHGVGMSQSGAKGMAKAGFNYVEILKHYYTGVTVG